MFVEMQNFRIAPANRAQPIKNPKSKIQNRKSRENAGFTCAKCGVCVRANLTQIIGLAKLFGEKLSTIRFTSGDICSVISYEMQRYKKNLKYKKKIVSLWFKKRKKGKISL